MTPTRRERGMAPRRGAGAVVSTSLALAMVLAACGSADVGPERGTAMDPGAAASQDGDRPSIVATTSILGDVVTEVVGEHAEVTTLMPAGVDPHGYAASARDGRTLREADLVVANGLGLEESLDDTLEAAEADGVRVLRLAEELDPRSFGEVGAPRAADDDGHTDDDQAHDDADDHGHAGEADAHDDDADDGHAGEADAHDEADDGHDHGSEDPHVWFDPLRMARGAELVAAAVADVDGSLPRSEWLERGQAYARQLHAIDDDLADRFAAIPADQRRMVTNHDSLGYLAARYDLEVVATVIPGSSTQASTDAAAFAELVELLADTSLNVVFAENTDSTRLAEQLRAELGRQDHDVRVVELYTDALGPPGSGAESYAGLLQTTAGRIAEALDDGTG